jgi:predicted Zn-dependent peptidase
MESPGARMQSQGRAVLTGQPVLTVDEVLARIDGVTHDDVMAAVRKYYDPGTWSTVCIGPRPEPFRAVTEGFEWEER